MRINGPWVLALTLEPPSRPGAITWLLACGVPAATALWFGVERFFGGFPPCSFRAVTGIPCAGCGTTRALRALLAGLWLEALLWNPLNVILILGVVWLCLLAWMHIFWTKLRRPHFVVVGRGWRLLAVWTIPVLLLLNWVYLVLAGRL